MSEGTANFTPREIINWLREHPSQCPICGGEEAALIRVRQELLEAKHKAYTDYREYVGLISQNESLRRQIDELKQRLAQSGVEGMT
jgi:hypothetical protein